MKRRRINPKVVAFVAVLVLSLVLAFFTGWNRPWLTKPEALWQDLLAPLESGVTTITQAGKDFFEGFTKYNRTKEENLLLQKQVEELTGELYLLEEYRLENLRLRSLVNFEASFVDQRELLAAKVIGRNPSNWRKTFTINKGRIHGLQEGMAVVTTKGVVGRIGILGERSAEVLLILDHEGALGGMVQNTRFPGIVEGTGDDKIPLQMVQLPYDSLVREDDIIVTSGLGGIFPKGLPIGYVINIIPESNGLMKKAQLLPFVDFDRIEEVLIVLPEKGEE
ncbi:MAG: rod shape-determining protein MreC [Bacillota bacterium]